MKKTNSKKNKKQILAIFEKNPQKQYNYKQISKILGHKKPAQQRVIEKILLKLNEENQIFEIKKGKYQLKKVKTKQGVLDMSIKRDPLVKLTNTNEEIHINSRKLNRALHNDIVEVSIYPKSKKNIIEGEILEIIERASTQYVGTIIKSNNFAFCSVNSKLMPYDIFIPIKKLKKAKHGDKVVVEIFDWPAYAKKPIGEIKTILGKSGEHNAEMHAILAEYGLPYKFSETINQKAKEISAEITSEEIKKRKDFRNTLTITIDPADAKDFDDAISIKTLDNNLYEIGIHIADVTYYVKENSAIDKEAYSRATSVYLVDRVVPMLPEILSNKICSLTPNTDKLTYSVVVKIDKNAKIKHTWIGRTIINSNKRFNYDEVQKIIETNKGEHSDKILTLNNIAQKLRQKRFENGAFSFDRGEIKFKIDEKGNPTEVIYKKSNEANQLVEEFMLTANKKVAEKIGKPTAKKPKKTFIYRVHDQPNYDKLKQFQEFALKQGYEIKLDNKKTIANSLNKLFADIKNIPQSDTIANFAIRSMARATYTTQNIGHYGLDFEYYTHFTSPIRRYPDIMVHRLLTKYLRKEESVNQQQYEQKCIHASEKEQLAMTAERASIKYKTVEFMKQHIGETFDGYISGITEWGIYVEIIPFKIEGMILIRNIADDFFFFDEANYTLIAHYSDKKFSIGDKVKIKVIKADLTKRMLDFKLI